MIFQNINLILDSYFCAIGFLLTKMFQLVLIMSRKEKKTRDFQICLTLSLFFFLFLYKPAWWINNHIWFFLGVPQRTLKVSSTGKKFFQIVFSRPQGFLICAFYLAVKILCEIHRRSGNLLTFNFKNNQ